MNENKLDITHIFCDVDYSIYNTSKSKYINPSIEALELAQKNGKKVIIVSSKSVPTLEQIGLFETLPYISGYICNCMGYGKVDGVEFDEPIPKSILIDIADEIDKAARSEDQGGEATDFQFVCCHFDEKKGKRVFDKKYYTYSKDYNSCAKKYDEKWNDRLGTICNETGKDFLTRLFNEYQVYCIMVFPFASDKNGILGTLGEFFSGSQKLAISNISFDGMYNINLTGSTKSVWIRKVLQQFGIEPNNCLAIGDGVDDAEMGSVFNKQFIGVVSDNHDSGASKYLNMNQSEIGFFERAELVSDDIYNIFLKHNIINPLPSFIPPGNLSSDIDADNLEQIGYVSCDKSGEKNLNNWVSDDNNIYFLGINGYGKVKGNDNDDLSNYKVLRRRISDKETKQKIKVLLMDPSSEEFDLLIEGVGSYKTLITYEEAYLRWFKLANLKANKHLDLRFYNFKPPFFMKAIDHNQMSITKYSSESSYIESFDKKEPSFVLGFEAKQKDKDGKVSKKTNSFCSNTIKYYDSLFEKSTEYKNSGLRKLKKILRNKIKNREKNLRPILFCYSSKNDIEKIYHIKDTLTVHGFDPIDWKGYDFKGEWARTVKGVMKTCSCVLFFLGENAFDKTKDDNVAEELYTYYELNKRNSRLRGKSSRKTEYALISLLKQDDLIQKFKEAIGQNEDTTGEKNDGNTTKTNNKQKGIDDKRKEAFNYYLEKIKPDNGGKIFYELKNDNLKDVEEELLGFVKNHVHPALINHKYRPKAKEEASGKSNDHRHQLNKADRDISNLLHVGLRRCLPSNYDASAKQMLDQITDLRLGAKICSFSEFSLAGDNHPRFKGVNKEFREFLDKRRDEVEEPDKINILLLDPRSSWFDLAINNIKAEDDLELAAHHVTCFKEWVRLAEDYADLLDVRIQGQSPQPFKMCSIDDKNMAFKPYDNTKKGQKNSKINYPTLFIEHGNKDEGANALFKMFNVLFDTMFKDSDNILDAKDFINNELASKYGLDNYNDGKQI